MVDSVLLEEIFKDAPDEAICIPTGSEIVYRKLGELAYQVDNDLSEELVRALHLRVSDSEEVKEEKQTWLNMVFGKKE